jgi:hypothetical protein
VTSLADEVWRDAPALSKPASSKSPEVILRGASGGTAGRCFGVGLGGPIVSESDGVADGGTEGESGGMGRSVLWSRGVADVSWKARCVVR